MADNRTQQWRAAKREAGLKAVTVWLTADEELRLKDLALQWHCSPSDIMQHALSQFHPGSPPRLSDDTDTSRHSISYDTDMSQIQSWLHAELPGMVRGIVEQLAMDMLLGDTDNSDETDTEEEEYLDTEVDMPYDTATELSHSGITDDTQNRCGGVPDITPNRSSNVAETRTEKVAVLARLRELRAEGLSFARMAEAMQAEGIPTLSGKGSWQKGTLVKLLGRN